MDATDHGRTRWQFSLKSLLVVVTVLGVKVSRARTELEAVAAIKRLGGSVQYDYELLRTVKVVSHGSTRLSGGGSISCEALIVWGRPNPSSPGPNWLRHWLGDEYFMSVAMVDLTKVQIPSTDLRCLGDLSDLRVLFLGGMQIGDRDMDQIARCLKLQYLDLSGTKVTDAGLTRLAALAELRVLHLGRYVQSNPYGAVPNLPAPPVTGEGLRHLAALKKLQLLDLTGADITDEDLKQLESLSELMILNCEGTHVTSAGFARLKAKLPKLQ